MVVYVIYRGGKDFVFQVVEYLRWRFGMSTPFHLQDEMMRRDSSFVPLVADPLIN